MMAWRRVCTWTRQAHLACGGSAAPPIEAYRFGYFRAIQRGASHTRTQHKPFALASHGQRLGLIAAPFLAQVSTFTVNKTQPSRALRRPPGHSWHEPSASMPS